MKLDRSDCFGFGFVAGALSTLMVVMLNGCSFNPPPNTGAYKRGLTETKESKARPTPVAVPQPYLYYTNAAYDRLVESHTIQPPPTPPGHGPVPVFVAAPAVSNMFTTKVLPKPLPANTNFPQRMILSRITTTDKNGKKFTAELTLEGETTVRADAKMSVIIFAIHHPSYLIESCTNIADGKWFPIASGSGDTNSALVLVDLHGGSRPIQFYRQRPGL